MRTTDAFLDALRGLRQKPGRSLLTTLGIIIGVAAVIVMLSLGKGAESVILSELESFGPDTLFLEPGGTEGVSQLASFTALKQSDAATLTALPETGALAPVLFIEEVANAGGEQVNATVFGTTPALREIESFEMQAGVFLAPEDAGASVVVLGSKIAGELFGAPADALGQEIRLGRRAFRVVGVAEPRGSQFFLDLDTYVYVLLQTAADKLFGVDYLTYVMLTPAPGVTADQLKEAVTAKIRERHRIEDPADDDFHITTAQEAAAIVSSVTLALTLFLTAVAGISLVVGGIGIMNIMLVSVTERTREIGLRMAVGATRRDIQRQFLSEAVVLTGVGGLLGIGLGIGAAFLASVAIAQFQDGWEFAISPEAVVISFVVAAGTGLVFGISPARRASRLNPIDALRYE
ncbi:FtsX-like permease family protein [Patescibacteria group bacterium]|nr:MAG: FtsX-like permease family protein [Patescibacteria group bacterium]